MGPVGARGEKGDRRDTGCVGPQGSTAPRDGQGADGKIGPEGDKGDRGAPAVELDIVAELCKQNKMRSYPKKLTLSYGLVTSWCIESQKVLTA